MEFYLENLSKQDGLREQERILEIKRAERNITQGNMGTHKHQVSTDRHYANLTKNGI